MNVRLTCDARDMVGKTGLAARYATAFAQHGTRHYIANAASTMWLAEIAGHAVPVTVDGGGHGLSYVANPHSAYGLYARRELDLVGVRRGRWAASTAIAGVAAMLRAVRINRIIHVDNWLLSTNLHGTWRGEGLAGLRELICTRWPEHFIALRTLDNWSCPELLDTARTDGWILLPSRQVWVIDDVARDWRPRNEIANDRRALARSRLQVECVVDLTAADAERIADLYARLYVGKYSALNPIFTADFMRLTHDLGMIEYRVARDGEDQILAVAGLYERTGVMTPAVVGYDTARPRAEALYRIASYMFGEAAEARGCGLHGSAGAAEFKRLRGARGVIEYMAIFADHLPAARRAPIAALAAALERWMVPKMRREGW